MFKLSLATAAATTMIAATLIATGCNKKDDAAGSAGAGKPVAGKPVATKLPKLGLQLDVAGETTLGDAIMGEGNLIQGSSVGAMQVETWKDPQTLDQAKDDAAMYKPRNVKAEPLADGWLLSYENTGAAGTNYFVTVRRDFAGKSYKCSTTGSDHGQADAVVAACKSLHP